MRRSASRSGVTLLEVLVAIFVMGIGLIALLTLFPLGILRMAQAIRDDRAAQAAYMGTSQANILRGAGNNHLRNDPQVISDPSAAASKDAFNNPLEGTLADAHPDRPSYPVFVDPAGYFMSTGLNSQYWLAGATGVIPRRRVSFAGTNGLSYMQWFTLLDDMPFNDAGLPRADTATVPPQFEYYGTYSWAYMLQRPRASDPSIVNMSVVVFENRVLSLTSGLALEESLFADSGGGPEQVVFNEAANTITIQVDPSVKSPPAVRTGDWLLDCSYIDASDAQFPNRGYANGNFYRIVGINEATPGERYEYEVTPPLRNTVSASFRRVLVLDGVVEVFDKGPGRLR